MAGQIHPSLIVTRHIQKAIELIENTNLNAYFPIEKGEVNLFELTRISTLKIFLKNNKILIDIEISLITETKLSLYELHKIPTRQKIFTNMEIFAYIKAVSEFTVITEDREGYIRTS